MAKLSLSYRTSPADAMAVLLTEDHEDFLSWVYKPDAEAFVFTFQPTADGTSKTTELVVAGWSMNRFSIADDD